MVTIGRVSSNELKQRKKQLQRQRRQKLWQTLWSSLLLSGMTGGIVWAATLPNWVIRQPEQIDIKGNHLLSEPEIRSLLPLSYPQSLFEIPLQHLTQQLEDAPPIQEATLTRELFPPSLTVEVIERIPVAIALATSSTQAEVGFLDAQGKWIPQSSYAQKRLPMTQPQLQVSGIEHEQFIHWPELYRIISHSTVQIFFVNWQDPQNLILETELGTVHFGAYSEHFQKQMISLSQMRNLPNQVNLSQVDYINLSDPDSPTLQFASSASEASEN